MDHDMRVSTHKQPLQEAVPGGKVGVELGELCGVATHAGVEFRQLVRRHQAPCRFVNATAPHGGGQASHARVNQEGPVKTSLVDGTIAAGRIAIAVDLAGRGLAERGNEALLEPSEKSK